MAGGFTFCAAMFGLTNTDVGVLTFKAGMRINSLPAIGKKNDERKNKNYGAL